MPKEAISCVLLLLAVASPRSGRGEDVAAQGHLDAGRAALESGDWLTAQTAFVSALLLQPGSTQAHFGVGVAQMRQGHFAAAAESFANCKRSLEERNAVEQASASRAEQALLDRVLELNDYIAFLYRKERTFSSEGNGSSFSEVTRAEHEIGQIERASGQRPTVRPIPAGLHLALGTARLKAGQLSAAESALLEAVAARPDLGPAHNNLAVVYMRTGRFGEARAALRRAEKCGLKVDREFKRRLEESRRRDP